MTVVRPFRRLAAGLLAATLLAATSSCAGDDGASTGTTASSDEPTMTIPDDGPCAWPTKADKATLNIAYPDTAATYWAFSYTLAPGEHLELRGRFPDARYASFITYGAGGGAIDTLTDRDIEPDEGDTNPFVDGGSPGGSYTIRVWSESSELTNALKAVAAPYVGPPTTDAGTTTAVPNTAPPLDDEARAALLGTGEPGGDGVVGGTLIYRVYLPNTADDLTGGGGLPDVRVVHDDGTDTEVPTCATSGPNPNAEAIVTANGPATDRPAPEAPIFIRPQAGAANLYPNPDNVYVVTILDHEPGRIVVVRGTAPTFPDTGAGEAVTGDEQVRYWSLCTNEYRTPYPVSWCVADQDVVLDGDGRYTFVVSTPEDRPANATADEGVTWVEWGSTEVDNLLLLRHMLASPEFPQSAIDLAPGSWATSTMGPYAPRGAYCQAATFEADGPQACPTPVD